MQSQLLKAMDAVETSLAEGVRKMTEDAFKREPIYSAPKPGPVDTFIEPKAVHVDAVKALLIERGKTHGNYTDHARITQRLKGIIAIEIIARANRGQSKLSPEALESLDMIAQKIGRILAGQWDHADHWDDISGYAKLVNGDR